MKCALLMTFVVLLVVCADDTHAWWGGSRSSRSSRSSSSSVRKQEKPKASVIDYVKGYVNGAKEMYNTYKEMKTATKEMVDDGKKTAGADKYFHAKANYKAAQHGPGGKDAAKHISDAREAYQKAFEKMKNIVGMVSDKGYNEYADDSAKDQEANKHGQNGGDPNKYRTKYIPDKYKK